MNLGKIYHKIKNGDTLSDDELDFAIGKFIDLENNLLDLGPIFELSRVEISHRLQQMVSWKAARMTRKERQKLRDDEKNDPFYPWS